MINRNVIHAAFFLVAVALGSTPVAAATSGTCVLKKPSTCQAPWSIKVTGGSDACYMYVLGHRVNGKYTVPSGYRYLDHPRNHGWKLRVDRHGIRDYWTKSYRCN